MVDELETYVTVSGVSLVVMGMVALCVGLAAFSTLCCEASPRNLRAAAQGGFGQTMLHAGVTLILPLFQPSWMPLQIFNIAVSLLLNTLFGIHFAGVLYQAARMRHFGQGRQGALQGATATQAPPPAVPDGVPGLGVTLPPGVAVHTSGVPGGASGL